MTRHLFKMVWNRKGANALITLEIFMSFLVVFAVVAIATQFWTRYQIPLGFIYQNVYDVQVNTGQSFGEPTSPEMTATTHRLAREIETLPAAEKVAITALEAFSGSNFTTSWGSSLNVKIDTGLMRVSPEYYDVMRLDLLAGRWFEPTDQQMHWRPVVISNELAKAAFGSQDPVGQVVVDKNEDGTETEFRVIGVIGTFRRQGEFTPPSNVMFQALWPDTGMNFPRRHLLVKVAAGTTAQFEEAMIKRLESLAPEWSFNARLLEEQRELYLRQHLAPLVVVGLIASFLMMMVGLGLVGVLWQNVTQRTRELGLRRAKGATAKNIHRQILTELMIVSTFGIGLASIVVAQVPMLGILPLDFDVFAASLGLSIALLYLLTALCGLYPSWLATRVQPAEALHYE